MGHNRVSTKTDIDTITHAKLGQGSATLACLRNSKIRHLTAGFKKILID